MSGYPGGSFLRAGQSTVVAACSDAVMRIVPAGFSRSSLKEFSCVPIASKAGRNVPRRREYPN